MARRPDYFTPIRVYTKEQLKEMRQGFARLHPSALQIRYQQLWTELRMSSNAPPHPAVVQELVQAWKQLWKWRRK